jgi:hypothetical protein
METLEWIPLSEPLPEMVFGADEYTIERYQKMEREQGLPVDPDLARQHHRQRQYDETKKTETYTGPTRNLPNQSAGNTQ